MENYWIVRFLLVAFFCVVNARSDPVGDMMMMADEEDFTNNFTPCHYDSPNVTDCIRDATETAKMFLAHGIPSLGIQPLEPLKIPNVRLRQHNAPKTGFRYDAWLSDVVVKGLTNYMFNTLDIFSEDLKVTGNISLPAICMTADFVIIGDFQMLPVEATGKIVANFSQCTARLMAQGAKVHETRMVVRDSDLALSCKGPFTSSLEEANTGKGDMAKMADHIVSMHSNDIIMELKPAVETALSMVLEDTANKFLKYIPFDEIFTQ